MLYVLSLLYKSDNTYKYNYMFFLLLYNSDDTQRKIYLFYYYYYNIKVMIDITRYYNL